MMAQFWRASAYDKCGECLVLFPSEAFGTGCESQFTSLEKDRCSPSPEYYSNTSSRCKQALNDEQSGSPHSLLTTLACFYFSCGHAKMSGLSAKNTANIRVSCVPHAINRLDSRTLKSHVSVSGNNKLTEKRVGIHGQF